MNLWPTPAPLVVKPSDQTRRKLEWRGSLMALGMLTGVNALLTLLTLGIYHFWAKTKVRRYIHEHILLLQEPFAYLGTGREAFFGMVRFLALIIFPAIILLALIAWSSGFFVTGVLAFVAFQTLIIFARLMGLRYRANRLAWRGIRCRLAVSQRDYLRLAIKIAALNFITLGFYRPYGDARMLELCCNRLHYGSLAASHIPNPSALTRGFWIIWVLGFLTFGLSHIWYRARLYRYIAATTQLGAMQFRYPITGRELFFLTITNALILIFSFRILLFYCHYRSLQLFLRTLRMRGLPDFERINKAATESIHDSAADYFNLDQDWGF
jgi:uncharacterized membrane protein YjgN (DUF898 family)